MIHSRVDHCNPVITSGQTCGYNGRQDAILRRGVQTLEINEILRVRRRRLVEPSQLFNHYMRMSQNVPTRVDLLRAGHISLLWVREPTGLEVADCDLDGERLVFRERLEVWRENKLGRGHVIHTRKDAHRDSVTRATYRIGVGRSTECPGVMSRTVYVLRIC